MWMVILLFKFIVVMGYLFGGFIIFLLLVWLVLCYVGVGVDDDCYVLLCKVVIFGVVLLVCQIVLGGWILLNYVVLVCGIDFFKCLGQWMLVIDFKEGFVFWCGVGVNYEGGVFDMVVCSVIQIVYCIGVLVVFCYFGWLLYKMVCVGLCGLGIVIGVVLVVQVLLGISNVYFGLLLWVVIVYNGVVVVLLFILFVIFVCIQCCWLDSLLLVELCG